MINNINRVGNFTSSKIVALTKEGKQPGTFGAPALTYIEEKNFERRLGRSLDTESNARPLSWGKCVESIAFEHIGLEYSLCSSETIIHPDYDFWAGSPDGEKRDTIAELKCPLTLLSFCQLVQPLYEGLTGIDAIMAIRKNHKDGEKYFYQCVSNAILRKKRFAELIIYCPYASEINDIKEQAEGNPNYYWIWSASMDELPSIPDVGYYKNINKIRFEVPQSEIEFLTKKVEQAGEMLIPRPDVMIAKFDNEVNATMVWK